MPHPSQPHLQRDRAESFGAVAADYDRFRPGYPDALLDELAALAGPDPVLDIGCGTGKAAAALAARGCDVLGVEVDAQMAEVARGHGVPVEVATFEDWDPAGRTFGLITAAQAWHWVDASVGAPKVCALLRPGGTFVALWNTHALAEPFRDASLRAYERTAPELVTPHRLGPEPEKRPYADDLERYGSFAEVTVTVTSAAFDLPVAEWVGRVSTHSDHLTLGADRLAAVREALTTELTALGPTVRIDGGTYVLRGRMAG